MQLGLLVLVAVASASTLTPPVLPLIVRNPYLSTWLTGAREKPWEKWPIFWTGHSVSRMPMRRGGRRQRLTDMALGRVLDHGLGARHT